MFCKDNFSPLICHRNYKRLQTSAQITWGHYPLLSCKDSQAWSSTYWWCTGTCKVPHSQLDCQGYSGVLVGIAGTCLWTGRENAAVRNWPTVLVQCHISSSTALVKDTCIFTGSTGRMWPYLGEPESLDMTTRSTVMLPIGILSSASMAL